MGEDIRQGGREGGGGGEEEGGEDGLGALRRGLQGHEERNGQLGGPAGRGNMRFRFGLVQLHVEELGRCLNWVLLRFCFLLPFSFHGIDFFFGSFFICIQRIMMYPSYGKISVFSKYKKRFFF